MKHDFTVVKLSGCHVMDDLMLTQLLAKVVSLSEKKRIPVRVLPQQQRVLAAVSASE